MNQPIVYALVAMVGYGLSDFIYKQAAATGIRADHVLMAQTWFFFPLVILYALATRTFVLDPANRSQACSSSSGSIISSAALSLARSAPTRQSFA
jgi:hypothetical protein